MRNVSARRVLMPMFAMVLGILVHAEEYQCNNDAGCTARITEDGELQEVSFRKGDIVSTEAGWVVSSDDGWVKVKTNTRPLDL
jgi:hypothetical protein